MKLTAKGAFRSKNKKLTAASLLTLLVAAAAIPIVMAQPAARYYTANISPVSVNAGATISFTITITNDPTTSANQKIQSATVQVPAGFAMGTLGTPVASGGKAWTATLVSGVIQLLKTGNDMLMVGESVSLTFAATAPNPAVTTDYEWTTAAYQSTDFTDTPFTLVGSQPVVTVVVEEVPDEEIVYSYETAYAHCPTVSNEFIDFGFGNWGWSNGPLSARTYTFEMWAGAAQCDLSKGVKVGTVEVIYGSGTVSVTFALNPGITLEEYHVYAGSGMFPSLSNGKETVAPGQYQIGTGLTGNIYVIVHAVVGIPQES